MKITQDVGDYAKSLERQAGLAQMAEKFNQAGGEIYQSEGIIIVEGVRLAITYPNYNDSYKMILFKNPLIQGGK